MFCIESAVLNQLYYCAEADLQFLKYLDTMNKFEAAHIDNRHLQLFCDSNYILALEPSEGYGV